MKNRIFSLLTLALLSNADLPAQSCVSIFESVRTVFNNAVHDYIDFRMDAAQVFVETIIPGKPNADSALDDVFDDATKLQHDIYNAGNVILGQGCGHVGAVNLMVPTARYACDGLYTERTFIIVEHPYDKVTIKVKKTGGKRGIKMKACSKYSSNNSIYSTKDKEIESGKDTAGQEREFVFTNQDSDKYITLHLVASGALPTDKAEYEIKITGEFNEDEMAKLGN